MTEDGHSTFLRKGGGAKAGGLDAALVGVERSNPRNFLDYANTQLID
jgi:hypothetical protein